jgi:hypothetical protein
MTAKTLVCIEVEVKDGKLVVRELGAGARDWFSDAPWQGHEHMLLRDILDVGDWRAINDLENFLRQCPAASLSQPVHTTHPSATCFEMVVSLCHFARSQGHLPIETVEYVPAQVQVAASTSVHHSSDRGLPAAVLIFHLPEGWQWKASVPPAPAEGAEAGAPAQIAGKWRHIDGNDDRGDSIADLANLAHGFMGAYNLCPPGFPAPRRDAQGNISQEGAFLLTERSSTLSSSDIQGIQGGSPAHLCVLKLPAALGGNDSPCEVIASSSYDDSFRLGAKAAADGAPTSAATVHHLRLFPASFRGVNDSKGLLLMMLAKEETGRSRVAHHLLLQKVKDQQSVLVRGVINNASSQPQPALLLASKVSDQSVATAGINSATPANSKLEDDCAMMEEKEHMFVDSFLRTDSTCSGWSKKTSVTTDSARTSSTCLPFLDEEWDCRCTCVADFGLVGDWRDPGLTSEGYGQLLHSAI